MPRYHVLYNPHAGNGHGTEDTMKLKDIMKDAELVFCDMTTIESYKTFFASLAEDDRVIVAGGDGTLNRFINDTDGLSLCHDVYYYATGSGNDFWHDLGFQKGDPPVCVNDYIKDLPVATVNGKSYRVLNGVGYGIDGYCCEVGDKLRNIPGKKINYTSIAIKGLLFHFHPVNATVTVDGVKHTYRKVWLAPTMHGRFYGGGMMPTPAQDRKNTDGTVSTMVMYKTGKLRTLMIFPSIFTGKHIEHTKSVAVLSGHEITVEFDRPTALQIDGETILGVTSCSVCAKAGKPAPEKETTAV